RFARPGEAGECAPEFLAGAPILILREVFIQQSETMRHHPNRSGLGPFQYPAGGGVTGNQQSSSTINQLFLYQSQPLTCQLGMISSVQAISQSHGAERDHIVKNPALIRITLRGQER